MRHYEGKSTERHEIGRSDSGIATVQTLQHQDGGHLRRVVPAVREIPWAAASAGDGQGGGGGVFDAPGGEPEGSLADAGNWGSGFIFFQKVHNYFEKNEIRFWPEAGIPA